MLFCPLHALRFLLWDPRFTTALKKSFHAESLASRHITTAPAKYGQIIDDSERPSGEAPAGGVASEPKHSPSERLQESA